MGPNTDNREIMKELALNGMDVARFNFSHGDHAEHKHRLEILESVREELGIPIASLLDTKGPEIRTGKLKDGKKVQLEAGETFTLTTDEIVGDNKIVSITYKGLVEDVKAGSTILIDDGLIELKVKDKKGNCIYDMITMRYPDALATIEIGTTVDVEDEFVVIGTKGRVTIPNDWWNTGYFEANISGKEFLKRYSFNFEGNGFRYLLQELMIMIRDKRTECTRLFYDESVRIIEILETINRKDNS